jgi:fatty acid desaturase
MNRREQESAVTVWRWPAWLAVLTLLGLVSALFVDGPGDAAAWFGLGLPLLVAAACIRRSSRRHR